MSVRKFKALFYAAYKRLQNYTLLKNAPGTPGTCVNMIKCLKWIDSQTLDICESYYVISADFSAPETKKSEKNLFVTKYAFFDAANNKITRRKNISYYSISPVVLYKEKGSIENDVLATRKLDYVDRRVVKIQEEVFNPMLAAIGFIPSETVERDKTFGECYTEQYYRHRRQQARDSAKFKQGFFKTLIHNLSR